MTSSLVDQSAASLRAIIERAIKGGQFVQCTLSKRRAGSGVDYTKVNARSIQLKGKPAVQLAYCFPKKETHENLSDQAAARQIVELLETTFEHGHLFTSEGDYNFRGLTDGSFRMKQSAATKDIGEQAHNRTKQYLIPEGMPCPFLVEIGVMNRRGAVKAAKRKKFRQINRFLEIVHDVVHDLPHDGTLQIVDFGCGKSYLTFALHHFLTAIQGRDVQIIGLDRDESVVEKCTAIAQRLGCHGLTFQTGDIADFSGCDNVDMAVSLHACDTATDDAIAKAVQWNADVILAVPCCQHELAKKLHHDGLEALTKHGILKERFAALATDALRAAALEIHGYATGVIEFIDMEHTAKNLLIRAVKQSTAGERRAERVEAYQRLKRELSVDAWHLEKVLELEQCSSTE